MAAIAKHLANLSVNKRAPTNLPNSLQLISPKLHGDELNLLSFKYAAPRISNLSDEDLFLHTQALLMKIHVITGWKVPENDALLNILQDQFIQKLKEDYGDVNTKEIEYAFRKFGTTVKDWGKEMNLNLIDTVMIPYMKHRSEMSHVEEVIQSNSREEYIPTEEELLSMKREVIENRYQGYLEGNLSLSLLPDNGLATLALDGFCDFEIYKDFTGKAIGHCSKRLQKEITELQATQKTALAAQKSDELKNIDADNIDVVIVSKKMALAYCFYRFKEAGYKNLYITENQQP